MPALWINDDKIFKRFKRFCKDNKLKEAACSTEAIEHWLKWSEELVK